MAADELIGKEGRRGLANLLALLLAPTPLFVFAEVRYHAPDPLLALER